MEKIFITAKILNYIEKNGIIASVLAFFFGSFGIHRFYLKQKYLGFLLIVLSFISSSIFPAFLYIIIIFTWIEATHLMIQGLKQLKLRNRNTRKIDANNNHIKQPENNEGTIILKTYDSEQSLNNASNNVIKSNKLDNSNITINSNGVYDVTNNVTEKITPKSSGDKNKQWENIFSEINIYHYDLTEQIKKQIKKIFFRITNDLNLDDYEHYKHYSIGRQIFAISEFAVDLKHTDGEGIYNHYYRIYFGELDNETVKGLINKAKNITGDLQNASKETKKFYNLTENGYVIKWWDEDGKYREEKTPSLNDIRLLNSMSGVRDTKPWKEHKYQFRILDFYFQLMDKIFTIIKVDQIKTIKKNRHMVNYVENNKITNAFNRLSFAVLKLSEYTIRETSPELVSIKIDKDIDVIKSNSSKEIYNSLKESMEKYINQNNSKLSKETNSSLNKNRKKINLNKSVIQQSRKDNDSLVNLVDEFIGNEDETVEQFVEGNFGKQLDQSPKSIDNEIRDELNSYLNNIENLKEESISIDLEESQADFIALLLKEDSITIEKATGLAMNYGKFLNLLISEINNIFYEEVEDEIILIEEDEVTINEDYYDFVKGVLTHE